MNRFAYFEGPPFERWECRAGKRVPVLDGWKHVLIVEIPSGKSGWCLAVIPERWREKGHPKGRFYPRGTWEKDPTAARPTVRPEILAENGISNPNVAAGIARLTIQRGAK